MLLIYFCCIRKINEIEVVGSIFLSPVLSIAIQLFPEQMGHLSRT